MQTNCLLYRIVGSSTWQTINNPTDNGFGYGLGNLAINTAYEFQMQTVCSGGGLSAFSPSYIFSTINEPNFFTIKAGNWNDYTVWSTGRIPALNAVFGYGSPVEIRHQITLPTGIVAPVSKITYTATGKLLFGAGARVVLKAE